MLFKKRQPAPTQQQQLKAKPIRLVDGELAPTEGDNGGGQLTVKLAPRRGFAGILRVPPEATKTFEFDSLGRFVWDRCDGKTTVQQMGRQLAKTFNVSEREAHVATAQFLAMLAKKGLIGRADPARAAKTS